MTFFNMVSLQASDMVLAENKIGTTIMIGGERDNNSIFHKNMHYLGVARKDCPECYSDSKMCEKHLAFKLAAIEVGGEPYPLKFKSSPLAIITLCVEGAFDKKSYLDNVTFTNYKNTYSENIWSKCKANILFTTVSTATDGSASLFITNSKCENCEKDIFVKFRPPSEKKLGWLGGCGNMVCTGQRNLLISDLDGKLFSKGNSGSQLVPKNPGVDFTKFGCSSYNSAWNGHECIGNQLGIITFESTATDKRDRVISPVNLLRSNFNNSLNIFNEWFWDGFNLFINKN